LLPARIPALRDHKARLRRGFTLDGVEEWQAMPKGVPLQIDAQNLQSRLGAKEG
jgi:hypothetical protein